MKVAVIGAGRMGAVHARNLRNAAGVDTVLVADPDLLRRDEVAAALAVETADDASSAIERADAVVIATPPSTHAAFVREAVAAGRPTLCEKPLADDIADSIALAAFTESSGIPVQVGFQRRFDPAYAAARARVESGALGRLQLIRLVGTEPVLPSSPLTNLFRNTAIHDFDLVRFLAGDEVVSIHVEGSQRSGAFDAELDPDTIVATLRLVGGALASVTVSRLSPFGYDVRAEVLGDNDHVAIGWTGQTPVQSVEPGAPALPDERWRTWERRFAAAYRAEISAFLAAARGEEPVRVTVRDGVAAQRIAEAASASFASRQTVLIDH